MDGYVKLTHSFNLYQLTKKLKNHYKIGFLEF